MPDDVHKPLRDDVRLLGELLGDVIRASGGDALFERVERVRALAKSGRAGRDDDFEALRTLLSTIDTSESIAIARAFAQFLTLANIAEQHHRTRRRRSYRRTADAPPQQGSCEETFATLVRNGIAPDRLHDAVCKLRIELVLTAHPTEIVRRTLIQKHNRVAALLAFRDRPDLSAAEREDSTLELRRLIETAYGTDEVRQTRPSPLDEVRSALVVFEQTLWEALPAYLRSVDRALIATTGRGLPLDVSPVRFGSWVGGDRDGNPFVTPDVTRQACLLARWMAADLYFGEVDALRVELSMNDASDELRAEAGGAHEPYRVVLRALRDRLGATRAALTAALATPEASWPSAPAGTNVCDTVEDLAKPLQLCYQSLADTGHQIVADGRLSDLLRRVAAFGLTLAPLDVRQHALRHAEALAAVIRSLGLGEYLDWTEERKQQFLVQELNNPRPLVPRDLQADEDVRETLATFRMIAALPPDSLNAYVISMATRPSDVLAVALLQKDAGVAHPLRIVPLIESAEALSGGGAMLRDLLKLGAYRERVGPRQEVMIGYSDSAREIGRFSAAWSLFRAQEDIVEACREHSVALTLFHGRGGSVGRGGGPTWLAVQSQPAGSIDGTLRVTEQGEMIQAKFGLPDIALRTLEVYTTATLSKVLSTDVDVRPEWRAMMESLAATATAAYRRIVYDDPHFVGYFEAATPARELASLNIGSRPAHRGAPQGVATLRAIPWQFAWTQTRLLLASWLGLDAALAGGLAEGQAAALEEAYREWPFFRVTLDLMEMVLAKADARIAGQYDRQLVPDDLQTLGTELRGRLATAVDAVLRVTGHAVLVEENSVLRRSIDVRNPYVDPINLLQVELLRRSRAHPDDERTHHALMVTINGIAAGLRNTG